MTLKELISFSCEYSAKICKEITESSSHGRELENYTEHECTNLLASIHGEAKDLWLDGLFIRFCSSFLFSIFSNFPFDFLYIVFVWRNKQLQEMEKKNTQKFHVICVSFFCVSSSMLVKFYRNSYMGTEIYLAFEVQDTSPNGNNKLGGCYTK